MKRKSIESILLLGGFQLLTRDRERITIQGKKDTALLASILLDPSHRVTRSYAEALLWSQRSDEQAKASLRQSLSNLRKQLDRLDNLELGSDRSEISIEFNDLSIDIEVLSEASQRPELEARIAAVELYNGVFLEGLDSIRDPSFEEWLSNRRTLYQDQYTHLLKGILVELDPESGTQQIKRLAHKLLDVDNCSEQGHSSLMQCYFSEGDKAKVIQQYRKCCGLLAKELSEKPSQALTSLYEKIRTAEPARQDLTKAVDRSAIPQPVYGLSVAVMNLAEIGESARSESLGFDIASDIRTGLSKFNWISVASRYANEELKSGLSGIHKILQDMNVRYVIDGSVRRSKRQDTIKIQLLDGIEPREVWGGSYEIQGSDQGSLDQSLAQIICQLEVELRTSELKRVRALKPDEFSAYDCVIRAVSNIELMTPESFHHADALFNRAIELDPDFAAVYTWKIYWEIFCIGQGWAADPQQEIIKAKKIADQALERDPEDSLALAIQGHFEAFVEHNFVYARELHKRAFTLNPYSSMVLILNSLTYSYCGKPEKALERLRTLEQMTRIESQHLFLYYIAKCIAFTFSHDYEAGVDWGRKCIGKSKSFTNGYKPIICCLGHLDRKTEAEPLIKTLLSLEPSFNLEKMREVYPFEKEEDRQHYIEGMAKAGLDDPR